MDSPILKRVERARSIAGWVLVTGLAVLLLAFFSSNVAMAQASKPEVKKPEDSHSQPSPVSEKDIAYCKPFLDKDGGYRDKKGGYYNPKAGTFTDETGGVVDNWGGYTYKDGSYKTKFGDFYDSKLNFVKTTTGETIKPEPGTTPAQLIQVMREDVADRHGYDKELILRSMVEQIKNDHPSANKPPQAK